MAEKVSAILDACVLYSAPLRDALLRLATSGVFAARWTDEIHFEWMTSLQQNRGLSITQLSEIRNLMEVAAPDAKVSGYEKYIEKITLPDLGDRHVAAAGVHSGADFIVTFNLKDFPDDSLSKFNVQAMHPDVFISERIHQHRKESLAAFRAQRGALARPPLSVTEFLDVLSKQRLPKTVALLQAAKDDI